MAIAFTTGVERTSNDVSVTLDRTGVTTGRLALYAVAMAAGSITGGTTGFNLINDIVFGVDEHLYVYWRVTNAADPATWIFTTDLGANARYCTSAHEFTGADTTTPIEVATEQANASSASVTAPGVNPAFTNDMLVFVGAVSNTSTWTPPSSPGSFTEHASGDNPAAANISLGMSYLLLSSGAATGDVVATASSAGTNAGMLIALRDASPVSEASGSLPIFRRPNTLVRL